MNEDVGAWGETSNASFSSISTPKNNHHASIIHQAMKPTSPINTVEEHTNIIVQSMKNKR